MEHIGHSLIDADGVEVNAFGDTKGQYLGIPDGITLPNGDDVHCAKAGDTLGVWRLVERWLDDVPPSPWHASTGRTVKFDGSKVIVTVAYEATASLVPSTITPRQARLALLQYGLLDQVEALTAKVGGSTRITWEYALEINRTDALIEALSGGLGLLPAAVDQIFRTASTL